MAEAKRRQQAELALRRAEQDAVRVRTNQMLPEEPPRRLPRRQAPPRKEPDAIETRATVTIAIVVDGRGFQIEAGIDEAPHAAAASPAPRRRGLRRGGGAGPVCSLGCVVGSPRGCIRRRCQWSCGI